MYNNQRQPKSSSNLGRIFRKLLLSAFVVFSFILYAVQKPFAGTAAENLATPGTTPLNTQIYTPTVNPQNDPSQTGLVPTFSPTEILTAATQNQVLPTPVPATPTSPSAKGLYKDGTYTGPQVNAFYGLVQVQTIIQNGKIKSVQFLQYPNDRRTSVRINNVAVPYLQQEAVQAQSSQVDIVTGATLTSEGFIRSLQSALSKAGG